jgi:RNA recognition motif-containing protein
VEACKPLNDINRPKAWSKYSKEAAKKIEKTKLNEKKVTEKSNETDKKSKKLAKLIGDLKDDEEFKEFLEANKAISSKENIWKNDVSLGLTHGERLNENETTSSKESKTKTKKKKNELKEKDVDEAKEPEGEEESKPKESQKVTDVENEDADFDNGRLFVRNLCYDCKEEDLEKLFASYGPLVEVTMPLDNFSKKPKGFAYVTCMFPEKAIKAFTDLDGSIFQGRMLHIIAAKSKREQNDDGVKLNFKEKKVNSSNSF